MIKQFKDVKINEEFEYQCSWFKKVSNMSASAEKTYINFPPDTEVDTKDDYHSYFNKPIPFKFGSREIISMKVSHNNENILESIKE